MKKAVVSPALALAALAVVGVSLEGCSSSSSDPGPFQLTASPADFTEGDTSTVELLLIDPARPESYAWRQVSGPVVPLTVTGPGRASVDVSGLEVAVDAGLAFEVDVVYEGGWGATARADVTVRPAEVVAAMGDGVQVGGAVLAAELVEHEGRAYLVYGNGNRLAARSLDRIPRTDCPVGDELPAATATPTAASAHVVHVPGGKPIDPGLGTPFGGPTDPGGVGLPTVSERDRLDAEPSGPFVYDLPQDPTILEHEVRLPATVLDLAVVQEGQRTWLLAAVGQDGIAVIEFLGIGGMQLRATVPVPYVLRDVELAQDNGVISTGNEVSGPGGRIVALETDGSSLWIANADFGIHQASLSDLIGPTGLVLAPGDPLPVATEVATVRYAGEEPWGGPRGLELHDGRLFAALGVAGIAVFDKGSMELLNAYNLYTDASVTEDWFLDLQPWSNMISQGYDTLTGLPNAKQASHEILNAWNGENVPRPWTDLASVGKYYYDARDVTVAELDGRSIAFVAYGPTGVVALDVTGFRTWTGFQASRPQYLGYVPAVPGPGPDARAGTFAARVQAQADDARLRACGVSAVEVVGNHVVAADLYGGLLVLAGADHPEWSWKQPDGPFDNDPLGLPGDHVPCYEWVTSYSMAGYAAMDPETMPVFTQVYPCVLATGAAEAGACGLATYADADFERTGGFDLVQLCGPDGLVLTDVANLGADAWPATATERASIATTRETAAAPAGSAGELLDVGMSLQVAASKDNVYLTDGERGLSAWAITGPLGAPKDTLRLTGNTAQIRKDGLTEMSAAHACNLTLDTRAGSVVSTCGNFGIRRTSVAALEAGAAVPGAPTLLEIEKADVFEHAKDVGSVPALPFPDQAMGVTTLGDLAFVADGANGLTVYDLTKDPTDVSSGYFVGNLGGSDGDPDLGVAHEVALWSSYPRLYALVAAGPRGIAVLDVTYAAAPQLVKVFEPARVHAQGGLGMADGRCTAVAVHDDVAFFAYDSFGVIGYRILDLVEPVPAGVDPARLWSVENAQTVFDHRPQDIGRFDLQEVPGYESLAGGALDVAVSAVGDEVTVLVAYGEAGVARLDWQRFGNPGLETLIPTAGEARSIAVSDGRIYVADGNGGLASFK